jgi:hypothetical protein
MVMGLVRDNTKTILTGYAERFLASRRSQSQGRCIPRSLKTVLNDLDSFLQLARTDKEGGGRQLIFLEKGTSEKTLMVRNFLLSRPDA